jgi:hypothetical protein
MPNHHDFFSQIWNFSKKINYLVLTFFAADFEKFFRAVFEPDVKAYFIFFLGFGVLEFCSLSVCCCSSDTLGV